MGIPIGYDPSEIMPGMPLPNTGYGGSLAANLGPSVGSAPSWMQGLRDIFTPQTSLVAGLAGVAGAFPNSGTQTTNSSGTSNTTANSNFNGSSTPILSEENQALLHQLTNQYSHLAQVGVNLQPYQQQQEQQINRNSGLASRASMEALARRGLSNSPVAGTVAANQEGNRINQITNFQQGIPLLANQLNLQNAGAAGQFAASIPHGTSQTGNTDSTSNTATTNNSTTKTSSGGGAGGFLGGLGKALSVGAGIASMFSDERLKENVVDIKDGLDKVLKMKGKAYNYIGDESKSSGFMAQDLEKLFPDVVDNSDPSGFKKVKYHELLPKIVKSIQELNDKVERRAA